MHMKENKTEWVKVKPQELDDEAEVEVNLLMNPSGRVQAFIHEETRYMFDDTDGFGI